MKKIIFLLILLPNFMFPQSIDDYLNAADESYKAGRYNEAITYLEKVIEIEPNYIDGYYLLARAKTAMLDDYGALIMINKALNISPDDWVCLAERGMIKINLKDYAGAVNDLKRALSFIEDDSSQLDSQITIDSYLSKAEEALKNEQSSSEQQINLDEVPTYRYLDYFKSGDEKYHNEDYAGAVADYTRALELNPVSGGSYFNRALAKYSLQDYSGALDDFNKALHWNPEQTDAYYIMGYCYYTQQNYNSAIKYYNDAIELHPERADIYYYRGCAKFESGDTAGACDDWKKAAELGNTKASEYLNKHCTKKL